MAQRLIPNSYEKLDQYRVGMDAATAGIAIPSLPFNATDWQTWVDARGVFNLLSGLST